MPFRTHEKQGLMWLTSESLSLPGVVHGFSTRTGGVSAPPWDSLDLGIGRGDEAACVQENYRRFCAAIGADAQRVVCSRQVHEDNVRLVTADDAGKGPWRERDYESVDAMICNTPGLALTVFSADCGIILLYDPVHHAIGAVHAGWRGAAMGLPRKTVEEMRRHFGTDPADLRCAIGAAIGQCCFETDDDVPAALRDAMGAGAEGYMIRRGSKWHVDLKGLNAHWLRSIGVQHIDVCSHCTACMPELYWSHRKMGNARGVQAAMIALQSQEAAV
ncbi:MAG: peptidoglycan editing factor PgeF [Clostridia bacterium]|nr:peptidoglycan editing factor PgeF [Clostridia bacterium]